MQLVMTTTLLSGPSRSYTLSARAACINGNRNIDCQQQQVQQLLQQQALAVLESCPGLPGYCPRSDSSANISGYLEPGLLPGNQTEQVESFLQQKGVVDQFLAGPGFEVGALGAWQCNTLRPVAGATVPFTLPGPKPIVPGSELLTSERARRSNNTCTSHAGAGVRLEAATTQARHSVKRGQGSCRQRSCHPPRA